MVIYYPRMYRYRLGAGRFRYLSVSAIVAQLEDDLTKESLADLLATDNYNMYRLVHIRIDYGATRDQELTRFDTLRIQI